MAAVDSIADLMAPGNLVILESTSPIGTTERYCKKNHGNASGPSGWRKRKGRACVSVAYCPERVLPGRILTELVNNDRCIGGVTRLARGALSVSTRRSSEGPAWQRRRGRRSW